MLGIAIIHFIKNSIQVTSAFLNLVELEACTVDDNVDALRQELSNRKFDLARLISIGTYNARVMTGINNDLFAKFKKEIPHLLLFRCLCHSLQLVVFHVIPCN